MRLRQIAKKLHKKIKKLPKEITISVGVLLLMLIAYILVFGIEKPVTFSYSGSNCIKHLTVLPSLHKIAAPSTYNARVANDIKAGGISWIAFSMCFTPREAPVSGVAKVSTAPFGGWFARKNFAIRVLPPVKAHVNKLEKPIPVSKPLEIQLAGEDKVFQYTLKLDDREADCIPRQSVLRCNIQTLQLAQGRLYNAQLLRYFNDKKVETVVTKKVNTLSATTVTDSSVKSGEIVYVKPKTLRLIFDKNVIKATPHLYRLEGDKRTEMEVSLALGDKTADLSFKDDLPRSAAYELTVDQLEATDGSTLEQPYKLAFNTSGGPKVTGISVGRTSVPLGATVVVSFDQPLSEKQDITRIVTLAGGASLKGRQGNQLLISLAGVPKCGDFSIKLTNDLESNYDIGGNSAWSFTGRTICYTINTIGYSSRGRPINAYYFGNGGRTVLFTGAIHGNEVGTRLLMERWIGELEANARNIPADKQIVVVPQINPDGVAAGTRVNGRNVDLNRNFATNDWQTDVTNVNNQPFPGGGGPSPMSEPETVAIASLAQALHPVLILSYHSIGGVVAANQTGSSSAFAATYASLSGYSNTTGQTGGTFEYQVSGTADDWYGEKLGIASILIELSSHTYHQFDRNRSAMWAMVNG